MPLCLLMLAVYADINKKNELLPESFQVLFDQRKIYRNAALFSAAIDI